MDTPGILDHSLVERNTIEMQAITALAHIRAAILYVMDISEQCGHSIEQQIELFNSIKPLFANKPLIVALNKVDILTPQELREDARELLSQLENDGIPIMPMSTLTEEGIVDIKVRACDELLVQRVEVKMRSKKMPEVLNRLHLAIPKARDTAERPPFIPPGVKPKKSTVSSMETDKETTNVAIKTKKLERDVELEMGDDYFLDLKKHYLLTNEDDKYDHIPEIFEGKNIADYIDPDIMQRLDDLEREEEMRVEAGVYESEPEDPEVLETRKMAVAVRKRKSFLRIKSRVKRTSNYPVMPRGVGRVSRKDFKQREGLNDSEMMDDGGNTNIVSVVPPYIIFFSSFSAGISWSKETSFEIKRPISNRIQNEIKLQTTQVSARFCSDDPLPCIIRQRPVWFA